MSLLFCVFVCCSPHTLRFPHHSPSLSGLLVLIGRTAQSTMRSSLVWLVASLLVVGVYGQAPSPTSFTWEFYNQLNCLGSPASNGTWITSTGCTSLPNAPLSSTFVVSESNMWSYDIYGASDCWSSSIVTSLSGTVGECKNLESGGGSYMLVTESPPPPPPMPMPPLLIYYGSASGFPGYQQCTKEIARFAVTFDRSCIAPPPAASQLGWVKLGLNATSGEITFSRYSDDQCNNELNYIQAYGDECMSYYGGNNQFGLRAFAAQTAPYMQSVYESTDCGGEVIANIPLTPGMCLVSANDGLDSFIFDLDAQTGSWNFTSFTDQYCFQPASVQSGLLDQCTIGKTNGQVIQPTPTLPRPRHSVTAPTPHTVTHKPAQVVAPQVTHRTRDRSHKRKRQPRGAKGAKAHE